MNLTEQKDLEFNRYIAYSKKGDRHRDAAGDSSDEESPKQESKDPRLSERLIRLKDHEDHSYHHVNPINLIGHRRLHLKKTDALPVHLDLQLELIQKGLNTGFIIVSQIE